VTRPVFFRRSAAPQVEQAHSWWREHRPAASLAVREDLAHVIALIAIHQASALLRRMLDCAVSVGFFSRA